MGPLPRLPGPRRRDRFAGWLRAHALEAALFFAAYGGHTLEQVHSNLDQRTRLIEFALGAKGLAAADLKARFEEAFPA